MSDEPVRGRGAWRVDGHDTGSRYYEFRTLHLMDGRRRFDDHDHLAVWFGVVAIQRCLNQAGYRHPVLGAIPVTGLFGPRTKWGVKWFQERRGLVADGVFGPVTARAMFVPLVRFFCGGVMGGHVIPSEHVLGMLDLESGFDPGAVSTWYKPSNGPDRGLAQINERWHPDIVDGEAFDPFFAIPYAAWRLHGARVQFAGKGPDLQDRCAIAQHNNPARAVEWWEVGSMGEDTDIYKYVQRVLERGAALTT